MIARRITQAGVLGLALYSGVRALAGTGSGGFERYCPFGGLETAWSMATTGHLSCATGEHNITLMAALFVAALFVRKAFCSWVCPVGTLEEWLAGLGRAVALFARGRRSPGMVDVPRRLDAALRLVRLPVLAAILVATALTGELVFRAYDPYYILFSLGGHDVRPWSWAIVACLGAAAVVVPMAWCRYLCPLGLALWPLSRVGLVAVERDGAACTSCRACDRACPHSLSVSTAGRVAFGECTLCLECTSACPTPGALGLRTPVLEARTSPWVVPALLVVLALAGTMGGSAVAIPSFTRDFAPIAGPARTVTMVVDGIRCVDTAKSAGRQLEGVAGVGRFRAHASRHGASVTYDPSRTSVGEIVRALESPVYDGDTGQYLFLQFTVLEVDTRPVER